MIKLYCQSALLYKQHIKIYPKYLLFIWNCITFQPVKYYGSSHILYKGLDPKWGSVQLKNKRNIKLNPHNQPLGNDDLYKTIENEVEPLKKNIKLQVILVIIIKFFIYNNCKL